MNKKQTDMNIRNIGVFAHVDAGKTTLSERMLVHAGAVSQAGSVDDGTAHTDTLPIERRRGISVKATCVRLQWKGMDINLIDTPGHTDFSAEIERSLWALDGAVLLAFDHVMAKLNVNLKFRSEWDSTPAVSSVTVTAKTAATVNYLTKTASADATAAAGEVPLNELSTPATGYGRSYSSLQVPQAIRAFTVIIDGKKYEYASTDDIVLTGGRYTTVNFIVGRDRIELDEITVAPWATDDVEHPEVDVELKHAAPGWHTYCESEF